MVGDIYNLTNFRNAINNLNIHEKNDLWQSIADICASHKLLFDLYNIQQERIVHLESVLGTSAVLPKSMQ